MARAVHQARTMSSVRNIAAAQAYIDPWEGSPSPVASRPSWMAALDAPEFLADPTALANLWTDLVRGRLRPLHETTTHDCVYLVAQIRDRPPGLSPGDTALVASVLCGEPRKALASELRIAVSTATGRVLRALARLDLADRPIPLSLVLSAQGWAGVARIPSARIAFFGDDCSRYLAVSVRRPATIHLTALTRGEQEVAQWLVEGATRPEIAERRETSVHTVAGQVHSIFSALRVTGRYALIRRAVELGCFHELRVAEATVGLPQR